MSSDDANLKFFEQPVLPTPQSIEQLRTINPVPSDSCPASITVAARPIHPHEPPPGDLCWLRVEQWLSAKAISPNTKRAYIKELKRLWGWIDKPWNKITTFDLTRYKYELETATIVDRKTGRLKPQLSPSSVAIAIRSLKSFFGWMQQAHYVAENPMLAISAPQEPHPESKELTDVQVKALYAALEQRRELRLRDTALLAVLSHGLRAEEASQLEIQDYDGKRLHIREAKAGSTGRVPLDQDARAAIDTYLEWKTEQGELLGVDAPLFTNRSRDPRVRGQRLTYDGIYAIVKTLGRLAVESATRALGVELEVADAIAWEIAALSEVHPHQLRHTFASNLVLGGMDVYLAMALTRHRSIAVFKRYSSRAREQQAERAFWQMRSNSAAENDSDL